MNAAIAARYKMVSGEASAAGGSESAQSEDTKRVSEESVWQTEVSFSVTTRTKRLTFFWN
jgi:hypothetical protein